MTSRIAVDIFRWNGFFQPEEIERFHGAGHRDAAGDVVPAVHIDCQIDSRSDCFSHCCDPLDHPADLVRGGMPVPFVIAESGFCLVHIELQRVEAERNNLPRSFCVRFG